MSVSDAACIAFLQWALPQLALRWPGFHKVRRQVCKRVRGRMSELGLSGFSEYQARLEADPAEWHVLDACCHITISRFFRDRGVFEVLRSRVLPDIAAHAGREGRAAHIWSAGCASGEEPYTLKILWDLEVAESYASVPLTLIATDIDDHVLTRAREGCFKQTSLHEMPMPLVERAFKRKEDLFCVRRRHREGIEFLHQDLRSQAPPLLFDLILCRYLAFTYFAPPLQRTVAARIVDRLLPGGYLAIGTHEKLPEGVWTLAPLAGSPQVFEKRAAV